MKTLEWLLVGTAVLSACGEPAAATDAGADAGQPVDSGPAPDVGPRDSGIDSGSGSVLLTNLAASCDAPADAIEAVLPDEAGHYAAARLAPPSYPFRVTSFDYAVGRPPDEPSACDGGLAHRVSVYVIDAHVPGASPSSDGSLVASFDVAAEPVTGFREIHRELSPPIDLTDGQSIVVAVEQATDDAAEPTSVCCIAACPGDPSALAGVDYWSNAAEEPYAWADTVTEFGFPVNLWITATGRPL